MDFETRCHSVDAGWFEVTLNVLENTSGGVRGERISLQA
jgi:hypothetical protein